MSDMVHEAFWAAVDDLNAGRAEPVENYLRLVPTEHRETLATMLADMLAERGPAMAPVDRDSADYAAALAAIDEVSASAGPAGVLPGALKTMRHARGIERDDVLAALAEDFDITGEVAKVKLRRAYHALESGKLLGSKLSHRLLASLARTFSANVREFIDGAIPSGPVARLSIAPMGRGSGEDEDPVVGIADGEDSGIAPDAEERLIDQLFFGGPDA